MLSEQEKSLWLRMLLVGFQKPQRRIVRHAFWTIGSVVAIARSKSSCGSVVCVVEIGLSLPGVMAWFSPDAASSKGYPIF
mmetsp:Transcript_35262/g.74095  ORF Transcript_35262/g.74095 Transcript_35262/m.74095 type:complete len:80 (+) Transcript_35262:1375-1614(+)